jgi:pyrroloquinoline quinone (PQQ) biosynthesis protein C
MLTREQLAETVDRVLRQEVARVMSTVPFARHLTDKQQELNEAYYLRHRVETIKRIRMTSKTDAIALAAMIEEDYDAARWWSRYVAEELDHDRLYMRDLEKHGYTWEQVDAIEPLPATTAMLEYLQKRIREIGSLAAVAYSVCVEWNSERASAKVVEKAEKKYSKKHVAGSKAHIGIDEHENHYQVMLDVAYSLLQKQGDDAELLIELMKDIMGFLGSYFRELYEETIARQTVAVA